MEPNTDHLSIPAPAVSVPRLMPVQRPRLFALLDEATKGRLTLLAAPAGYGKTMLLTSWVAGSDGPPAAWVTTGPDDRQPSRFWAHVLDALHSVGAPAPEGLAVEASRRLPSDHRFLHSLATWLGERPQPVILIIDDFHELTDSSASGELGYLLRHAPAQLRLVVATRAEPSLSLQRLRVAGQLTEIRDAALAFTLLETHDLLAREGVTLSDSQQQALWRRTDGWAAGLRLAVLSLLDHPDPGRYVAGLAGDDPAIARYFTEEVLAGQTPEARAFLLRTSVVDRLCGGLADAVTGLSNGTGILAWLEREHVFTFTTGTTSWYRYHRLFAELLRAELSREHPGELVTLHRRAAAWYAASGHPAAAARHALAGDDPDHAARLVTSTWFSQLVDGRARELGGLVTRLPAERVRTTPHLAVVAALSRLAQGELYEGDAWLGFAAAAEPRLSSLSASLTDTPGSSAARERGTAAGLTLARLLRARLVGDAADAATAADLLLAGRPEHVGEQLGNADDRRVLAYTLLGGAEFWGGQLDDAALHLEHARVDAARTGHAYLELDATAHLALLESLRGSLRRADGLVRSVREQVNRSGRFTGAPAACAELAAAVTAYHRDERVVAATALERATEAARDHVVILLVSAVWGALLGASGRPELQSSAVERLDAAARATGGRPPPLLAAPARAARARLLAARGEDSAAIAMLAGHGAPLAAIEVATLGQLQLAGGDPAAASATVAPLLAGERGDPAAFRLPWMIEASLVNAVAQHDLGDHAAASRSLRQALELGSQDGYRRAFVDGGTAVQMLLVEHLKHDFSHQAMAAMLLEWLRQAAVSGRLPGATPAPKGLAAPLSERELMVLRYLPTTLSAHEIANELYISRNTVKTHIKNIYRKLNSNRRSEAVRRAQQLQLL